MPEPRLGPLEPPYDQPIADLLARYPQGPEGPIRLFRTLARSERALVKIASGGLLDKGSPLAVKHREILILRTSYRCSTPYEWGIHVKAFSEYAGLSDKQVADTCRAVCDSAYWSAEEMTLLKVADQLHDRSDIDDDTWNELQAGFSVEQIFEIIMLVGFYHMIAFLNNGIRVVQEEGTPTF